MAFVALRKLLLLSMLLNVSTASSFVPASSAFVTSTTSSEKMSHGLGRLSKVSSGGGKNRSVELGAAKDLGPNAAPPGPLRRALPNFPWHRVPNMLTYIRCLSIPALVVLFNMPGRHLECGTLFAVASFTDWLDGFLARRWDISSAFGAFLDPVADKLMVSTALILLAGRYGSEVSIPTSIILAREISVSALREWMAQRGLRDLVKVGFQGKLKTAATMLSLTLLLLVPTNVNTGFLSHLYDPALITLYLCTLVTVTSGSVYFRAAAPILMESE